MGFTTTLGGGPARTTEFGRSYSGTTVSVDRVSLDLSELTAAGWTILADHKGTTAQRPVIDELNLPLQSGFRYLDTTLGRVVLRTSAGGWMDGMTGVPS